MELRFVGMVLEGFGDEVGDLLDVFFLQAARGDGWGADANSGGFHRAAGIEGDAVFVDGDPGLIEGEGGLGTVQAFCPEIDEQHVVVCATRADAQAVLGQACGDPFGQRPLAVIPMCDDTKITYILHSPYNSVQI